MATIKLTFYYDKQHSNEMRYTIDDKVAKVIQEGIAWLNANVPGTQGKGFQTFLGDSDNPRSEEITKQDVKDNKSLADVNAWSPCFLVFMDDNEGG